MNAQMIFRPMQVEDLDQIIKIEHASFTLPWSKQAFANEITQNTYAHYLVVEVDDEVVGYCGCWIIVDEAHITNIAVLPAFRGQGLGEALLVKMIEYAKENGAVAMTLEVRVTNTAAQGLYRKLGFQGGGIRRQYYTDNMEDALVMWVKLDE